jgi:predicted DNA-binding protein with PD1-like motif
LEKGKIGAIYISRLLEDDDLLDGMRRAIEKSGCRAGALFVIGALKNLVAGCLVNGEYKLINVKGPLEIASCIGNVAVDEDGEIAIHAHLLASNEKGEAFGGHLMKGCKVGVTAELIMIEALGIKLRRIKKEKTQFRLLDLG